MIALPTDFIADMRGLLGAEAAAFIEGFGQPSVRGLRFKPGIAHDIAPQFIAEPIPWEPLGYYIPDEVAPGASIFHLIGAYYVQEPSAMVTAQAIDVRPGMNVLDLCAAPGGKSTQLAGRLAGEGLLIVNEPVQSRAQVLSENIERMGVRNAIVVSEYPDKLAMRLPGFFDAILVDAPCSGEGMFRRVPDSVAQWNSDAPQACHVRQLDILESACGMLKPGGCLAYSTCTFNAVENEGTVNALLRAHPELAPEEFELPGLGGSRDGMLRVWPHRARGEGHFAARLRKRWNSHNGDVPGEARGAGDERDTRDARGNRIGSGLRRTARQPLRKSASPALSQAALRSAADMLAGSLDMASFGNLCAFGNELYSLPDGAPALDGLKVLRPGLHLCTMSNSYVTPAHALARALEPKQVRNLELTLAQALRAVRGEQLDIELPNGYMLLTHNGLSICWGKSSSGRVRCLYPKGLRALKLSEDYSTNSL